MGKGLQPPKHLPEYTYGCDVFPNGVMWLMRQEDLGKSNLEDGLVLATVTAAYCPFLSPLHFQAMFTQPSTVSQAYHNTVCLTSAWDKIRLGYSVTPRDLMRPNVVNMLMLVAHLYRNLPSYKLETTVSFMATLNTSETQVTLLVTLSYLIHVYYASNLTIFSQAYDTPLPQPAFLQARDHRLIHGHPQHQ
ncbi:hypothetical protein J6590_033954 [Homalodisca vitripennis]|nr:hypothetical protein J6590_033954 [Homalodisca vitripennis]